MGFSRFISDDEEEDEYQRGLHQSKDWAWLVKAARDPAGASMGSAPTDPRQARRPDGLDAALAMKEEQGTKGQMPTLAPGDFGGSTNTAKRIQIAQWGDEDADEDRLTPEQIEPGNKMLSSTDSTEPVKPPGPDSPSTGYKEPLRYDKAKEAYDKEFGPGKKHKWYSMESTKDWQARRASMQHDLMLDQRQEEEERRQAIGNRVRPSGQAMRMTGDQGDGIYQGYSDGTFKKVGGVLDKDADQKYEPGVVTTGDRWLGRVRNDSNVVDPLMGKFFLSDANPFAGGAGPLSPDAEVPQRKWISEKNDPDEVVITSEGQSINKWNPETKRYDEVGAAKPKTYAPRSTTGGDSDADQKKDLKDAIKYAADEAEKEMGKKKFSSDAAKAAFLKEAKTRHRNEYLAQLGYTVEEPKKGDSAKRHVPGN